MRQKKNAKQTMRYKGMQITPTWQPFIARFSHKMVRYFSVKSVTFSNFLVLGSTLFSPKI